ncbi:hypothetical protein ABZP36_021845 [Zizania latifolia]
MKKKEYVEVEEQEKVFALILSLKYLDSMDSEGNYRLETDEEEDEEGEGDEEEELTLNNLQTREAELKKDVKQQRNTE